MTSPFYVIKAEELAALNFLDRNHPRPRQLEWINRGTDQLLRPTSVDMLLRTLFSSANSPSVRRLHQTAGLRVIFSTRAERDAFAKAFAAARTKEVGINHRLISAVFGERTKAEQVVTKLKECGIADDAISIMWRASKFLDGDYRWSEGHGTLSVAGAIASGGVAGAVLGVGVLFIPGVGPVAMAGVLAATAFATVPAIGGALGATGGAIAKMLTDHDVDGVAARIYEEEIERGKVFVSVDTAKTALDQDEVLKILQRMGGTAACLSESKYEV